MFTLLTWRDILPFGGFPQFEAVCRIDHMAGWVGDSGLRQYRM